MKKALRLKLLVLCRTRVRKSCPDMFKVYVILTGPDLVTDIAGLTPAGTISEPHHYKQKVQKMKDVPKIWI